MAYETIPPSVLQELKEGDSKEELGSMDATPRINPAHFKKGKSGNPLGRPKGSKNRKTIAKEITQDKVSSMIYAKAPKVVEVILEQAMNGCRRSQKLVWQSLVPTMRQGDTVDKGPARVVINIEGMTPKEDVYIDADVIEEDNEEC